MEYDRRPQYDSSDRTQRKKVPDPQPGAEGPPTLKQGGLGINLANLSAYPPAKESRQQPGAAQPVLMAQAAVLPTGPVSMGLWEFMKREIIRRAPALAAKVAGLSLADGALPIGELIALGLTVWTLKEIYDAYQVHMSTSEESSSNESEANGDHDKAAAKVPDLTGKTRQEAEEELNDNGFQKDKTTPGGYERWRHEDGSEIWIGPDGEVDRFLPKERSSVTGKMYKPRIDQHGNRIPWQPGTAGGHHTGEIINLD
jgi:hypothetical protein